MKELYLYYIPTRGYDGFNDGSHKLYGKVWIVQSHPTLFNLTRCAVEHEQGV